MVTLSEILGSGVRKYVICPKCKNSAGYHSFFDFNKKISFRCKCNKTLTQIKREYENN
jgi:hypothetical protein